MRTRNTTPVGVKPVSEYTFDELITHLHDHHGYTAEAQAEDEAGNGTDPATVAEIRAMGRDDAIARLPYHYFQNYGTPDSLESARLTHAHEHADSTDGGGYGLAHFHPATGDES